ncbi:hypothetical protein SCOCK_800014 [Actinacidiphila cocklensis]|uniref:Uncharacterized protein n=1 Tax=Actinacidiphila cocklensis TaxID=887465 RepID=A0A9W4GWC1_9ACTN|nr:hypothetical protein SCOCK_800014 [Actinacidiphila cocklensis]
MGGARRRQRGADGADRRAEAGRLRLRVELRRRAHRCRARGDDVPLRRRERLRRRLVQRAPQRLEAAGVLLAGEGLRRYAAGQHPAGDQLDDGREQRIGSGGRPVRRVDDGQRPERRPDQVPVDVLVEVRGQRDRAAPGGLHADRGRAVHGDRAEDARGVEGLRLRLRRARQRRHRDEVLPGGRPAGAGDERGAGQADDGVVVPERPDRRLPVHAGHGHRRQHGHPVGERLERSAVDPGRPGGRHGGQARAVGVGGGLRQGVPGAVVERRQHMDERLLDDDRDGWCRHPRRQRLRAVRAGDDRAARDGVRRFAVRVRGLRVTGRPG